MRKTEIVVLHGHIENVMYGKFAGSRHKNTNLSCVSSVPDATNTTHESKHAHGCQFIIAKFKLHVPLIPLSTTTTTTTTKSNNSSSITHANQNNISGNNPIVVIKGHIPFHSWYFDYKLECVERWDSKFNHFYFEIVKVAHIHLNTPQITPWIAQWIVLVENQKTNQFLVDTVAAFTDMVIPNLGNLVRPIPLAPPPPPSSSVSQSKVIIPRKPTAPSMKKLMEQKSILRLHRSPNHIFATQLYPDSEHSNWLSSSILLAFFPNDAHAIMSSPQCKNITEHVVRLASDPNQSWKLMIKWARKKFVSKQLKNKPAIPWIVQTNTKEPDDVEDKDIHDADMAEMMKVHKETAVSFGTSSLFFLLLQQYTHYFG